ncbi:MAG: 1-acyl-sn-glycerol-3-phosphate acyltransferase, partial [Arenimonas sp.]
MTVSNAASSASPDGLRLLRYLYRIPLLAFHACVFLPMTLLTINPICARMVFRGERLDHRAIR